MKATNLIKYYKNKSYREKVILKAGFEFTLNIIYALYNGLIGVFTESVWFITLSAYYIILSAMRFSTLLCVRKSTPSSELFVKKFSGYLLIVLSLTLTVSAYLSFKYDVTPKYNEIIMITIATYTFTKITLAIYNGITVRKTKSPLLVTARNITCADAVVSIFTLQRSMLVSFGEKNIIRDYVLNIFTGAMVFMFVFGLGVTMVIATKKIKRRIK